MRLVLSLRGAAFHNISMQEINIYEKSRELASLMKGNPKAIDRNLLHKGAEVIGIFRDPNFGDQFAGRRALEADMLKFAIEDVSMGALSLANNQVGLTYRDRRIQTFMNPLGMPPAGNVVMSLSLKKRSAFKGFRSEETNNGLEQEEVDAALYYLTFLLSEVID